MPVSLSALFCLLVALVCCPSLPLARSGAAGLAAIALTSVAWDTNHEDDMAVPPQTTPAAKRALGSEAVAISAMLSFKGQHTADTDWMIDDVAGLRQTGESSEKDDFR